MAFCLVADTKYLNLLDSELRMIDRKPIAGTVRSMTVSADLTVYVAIKNMVHMFSFGAGGFNTDHAEIIVDQDESAVVSVVRVSPAGCVYTLFEDYTLSKWSRDLQVLIHCIEFEVTELPFSLSCFCDTEDVLVGYQDGSFAVYDKDGVRQFKKAYVVDSPVTFVHGMNNYILVGHRSGLCSFFKMINYRVECSCKMRESDGRGGSAIVGGGISYNQGNIQEISDIDTDTMRLLIVAGTANGTIGFVYPDTKPIVAIQGFKLERDMFQLQVTRHGRCFYAGCQMKLLRIVLKLGKPYITHVFTAAGPITAIALCGM